MTLGNVRERPLPEIVRDMTARFPSEGSCFINKNCRLFQALSGGSVPMPPEASLRLLDKVTFGDSADFFKLLDS